MNDLDWLHLAEQLEQGQLDEVGATLGVVLGASEVEGLKKLGKRVNHDTPGVPRVLAAVHAATHAEHGLGHLRFRSWDWVVHCLAVRVGDDVFADVAYDLRAKLDYHHPALAGWSAKLEKNVSRAKAWAQSGSAPLKLRARGGQRPDVKAGPDAALEQLRAAVLAAPDDDGPRLVLADALIERGQVRGELIRLQCAEAKGATELRPRIRQILTVSAKTFAGVAAPYLEDGSFRRGFVESVQMTPAAFAKHGAAVLAAEPVKRVTITRGDLARLRQTAALARVRELRIIENHPGRPALLAPGFVTDFPLEMLTRLELRDSGVSAADWRAALQGLNAPKLETLVIGGRTSSALLAGLAKNPFVSRLRAVELHSSRDLDAARSAAQYAAALRALGEAHPTLEVLDLLGLEALGDSGPATFFAGTNGARLKHLKLYRCGATDALVARIARSSRAGALESVLLGSSALTGSGLVPLLRLPRLAALAWAGEPTDPEPLLKALLALPAQHPLKRVDLPYRLHLDRALTEKLEARFELRSR